MSFFDWLSIALICLIGAASPGPSLLIISYQATSFSFKSAIICSIAHGFGIFVYAFVTALGVSMLMIEFPDFFLSLKASGIVFLLYLGIKMLSYKELNSNSLLYASSFQNPIIVGFLASFLNRKIILFFTSIFSQFISLDINLYQKILIAILASLIDIAWYILFILFLEYSLSDVIKKNKVILVKSMGIFLIISTLIMIKNLSNYF